MANVPLSKETIEMVKRAEELCQKLKLPVLGTEHLLYGMIEIDCEAGRVLKEIGLTLELLLKFYEGTANSAYYGRPQYSERVNNLLLLCYKELAFYGLTEVCPEHFLLMILKDGKSYGARVIDGFKPNYELMTIRLVTSFSKRDVKRADGGAKGLPSQLQDMGVDMTRKAREGKIDPIIGRNQEIERIIQILCRKTKNNPVLIGEPGVGKSAVVEGLSLAIKDGNVPEMLKDKIVFALDIGGIVAGTKYRGALEEKLKNAIDLIISHGNIIVFIDELHTLATAGSDKGEVTPSDMLKPYLARGELQTIGATTTDEYRKFIEADKALERRFQPIMVNAPSVEETIEILKGIKENYEKFHRIAISDEAIKASAQLSDRYIMDRQLPDKAIDLIDEASSKARVKKNVIPLDIKNLEDELRRANVQKQELLAKFEYSKITPVHERIQKLEAEIATKKLEWEQGQHTSGYTITAEDIAEIVSQWTKIPVTKINETEKERLLKLEEILHKRVIGQDEAITAVSKAIRRARAGLKDPNRPIGTFLFLGPTGVGKTELTKAIAEAMFDDEGLIIRLDMSEYMESHSVSKMIGSPPGYVGFDDGGQLTEAVRRKPYSVVLFDEIEKAHNDVFNILLQILDEGRLTDAQGRVVNFKNTIIIMTSNVGVDRLKETRKYGFGDGTSNSAGNTKDVLMDELKRRFKPEFLNRIDVVTIFHALAKEDIRQIAEIMIARVNKKLAEKQITLKLTDTALQKLIDEGFSTEYGARPLRRAIEHSIEDNFAEAILSGDIKEGDNVEVDVRDGEFVFKAL